MGSSTSLLVIEENKEFYELLKLKYGSCKGVILINGSAEQVDEYLETYQLGKADYIVSGLPFTSLKEKISKCILSKTHSVLKEEGKFITFQYSRLKWNLFQNYFSISNYKRVLLNCPPAYVVEMKRGIVGVR